MSNPIVEVTERGVSVSREGRKRCYSVPPSGLTVNCSNPNCTGGGISISGNPIPQESVLCPGSEPAIHKHLGGRTCPNSFDVRVKEEPEDDGAPQAREPSTNTESEENPQ